MSRALMSSRAVTAVFCSLLSRIRSGSQGAIELVVVNIGQNRGGQQTANLRDSLGPCASAARIAVAEIGCGVTDTAKMAPAGRGFKLRPCPRGSGSARARPAARAAHPRRGAPGRVTTTMCASSRSRASDATSAARGTRRRRRRAPAAASGPRRAAPERDHRVTSSGALDLARVDLEAGKFGHAPAPASRAGARRSRRAPPGAADRRPGRSESPEAERRAHSRASSQVPVVDGIERAAEHAASSPRL